MEDDPEVGRALMALRWHPHSDQKDKCACQGDREEEHHQTGTCGQSLTNSILRIVHGLNSWQRSPPLNSVAMTPLLPAKWRDV